MRDYLSIGATPSDESCTQAGTDPQQEHAECAHFIKRIIQVLGPPPDGAKLAVKTFPHDFGDYKEVVVYYDPSNEAASNYAFEVESDAPTTW